MSDRPSTRATEARPTSTDLLRQNGGRPAPSLKGGCRAGWGDVAAVAVLLTLILLFVGPALLPGRVLLPLDLVVQAWPPWQQPNQPDNVHNPILGDAVTYIYPVKQFAADAVRSGTLPLWNPYVLGGYPFTYNTQAGLFYPLSLFYYLLPGPTAVDATIVAQMFLGALFMYLYLRAIRLKQLAAAAGGFLFIFNGLMTVWLEWQVVHAAVIWLPLQLYFTERLAGRLEETADADRPGMRRGTGVAPLVVAIGIALAIPWLGGHWNWTLYGSLTLAAYLLWRLGPAIITGPTYQSRARRLGLIVLPLLLGLGLSLVQVLPAAHYLSQSHRGTLPFDVSLGYGLLDRLPALLVPNFFGDPINRNWWGPVNYAETTFYVGILPLLLAGLAPWLRRDRLTTFFAGWGLLGLLWALGTPVYGLLYILPIFGGLLPSRAAILFVFGAAVLAALSLDRLLERELTGRRLGRIAVAWVAILLLTLAGYTLYYRVEVVQNWDYLRAEFLLFGLLLAAGLALLLARLRGWLSPVPAGGLMLALLVVDLFIFGYGYNTVGAVSDLYPPTATAAYLQNDPELFRMVTLPTGKAYQPNSSLVPRIANLSGYEPGILRRVLNYLNAAEGGSVLHFEREVMPLQAVDSPLLDLLNVKYVVTTADWWQERSRPILQQEVVDTSLSLDPGQPIVQPFIVPDAGLHRIDLWLRPLQEPSGTVTVRVLTEDGGQELAHATLSETEFKAEGWTSFYFGAFPSEWGRAFRLTVTFDGEVGRLALGATAESGPLPAPTSSGESFDSSLALVAYHLPRPNLVFEEGKTRIYERDHYFPRAFPVSQAIVAESETDALAAVLAQQGELDRRVVLELDGQPAPPAVGAAPDEPSTVAITAYELNRMTLTAEMAAPGFVVIGDVYYPGWRATVDGIPTPLYRANSILRAVYLPAGQHTVVLTFRPADFVAGGVISLLILVLCAGALLQHWRRRTIP